MADRDDPDGESDLEREAAGLPPSPHAGAQSAVDPPRPVRISLWCWVASTVALIVGFVLLLVRQEQIVDDLVEANPDARVTAEDIAGGAPAVLWMLGFGGLMFALLILLFAYKMREGTRSARSVLVALTLLMIVFQLTMPPFTNVGTILGVVLACAASVPMFLPSVAHYFPALPRSPGRWRGSG